MAWKKKFPGIASAIAPDTEPTEPMSSAIPAMPAAPALPKAQLPGAPMMSLQPTQQEDVKRRALKNIAMGRKGF